ncbi:hypothetical protein [Bacillus mycoides]|uniref:hypothetical protein n=1 Tax=Bacillus mycoides TaxID=1405 RepID=UPI00207917E7|nr:hypothetical protein [Bacillus mycoides]
MSNCLRQAYTSKVISCKRKLKPVEHEEILETAFEKIHERGIWIPEYEVDRYYKSKINKWHNKIRISNLVE